MASFAELDKFVSKFKSLWETGSNVSMTVEANAGLAKISLHVNVALKVQDQVELADSFRRGGGYGGKGSPCRQRRRIRRAAERQARANATGDAVTARSAAEMDQSQVARVHDIQEAESDVEFVVVVDVQEGVEGYDIVEAFEENFTAVLIDVNVNLDDACQSMLIHKIEEDEYQDDINGRMRCINYEIFVKNV